MNPQDLSASDEAIEKIDNPLKVMQPGERVICEIKRHPIGLLGIYGSFIFTVVIAITAVVAAPEIFSGISSQGQAAAALGAVIICALVGLFSYIGAIVYKGNRWIVTTDSITQVTQYSLFRKQTSQLSLANLEDVTVEQDGIIPTMFGYGRLRAETAGERSKFVFDFCPNPSNHAKLIINAHETYIAENPEEMHTTNMALANTAAFNQSYGPMQPGQQPMQQPSYGPPPQQYQQQPYQQQAPQQPYQGQPAPQSYQNQQQESQEPPENQTGQ